MNGHRRKAVLATLGLRVGEIVPIDWLVDVVWGGSPSPSVVNTVQVHVSQLRRVLGDRDAIRSTAPGYVLDAHAVRVDAREAGQQLARTRQLTDPAQRVRELRTALELWRGPALFDVRGTPWLDEQARLLDELRWGAERLLIEARLEIGEHTELLAQLESLIADHPLDEDLHRQLALALYRSSRQADALAVVGRLKRTLDDELGLAPSKAVQELETAILRQDRDLDIVGPVGTLPRSSPESVRLPPAQLPAGVPSFVGRPGEVAELDDLVSGPDGTGAPVAVISAVSGTAGMGKTALAVHWAHRVKQHFPDGQLYIDLRGFHPERPVASADALATFLHALGAGRDIPRELDARAAAYRSQLAGRKMLLLLDNASSAAQVRPLLPGGETVVTVVTSRDPLAPLVASGARALRLDSLTAGEALELLTERIGAHRVTAEPEAADRIVLACGGLPLALAIVAARAATQPGVPLTELAGELEAAGGRLDALSTDEDVLSVRAVFSWSYRHLEPAAARVFRLLGLHPGPDIGEPAVAALAGLPVVAARRALAVLVQANLVTRHRAHRYRLHDLLREYSADLAQEHDDEDARRAAVLRLLDHYVHIGHACSRLIHAQRDAIPLPLAAPVDGNTVTPPTDVDQALAWYTVEHEVVLSLVPFAADAGFDRQAWQLAWMINSFLDRRGHWHDMVSVWQTAVAAADRLGHPGAQGTANRILAHALTLVGEPDSAVDRHLQLAIEHYVRADEVLGAANTHRTRAWVSIRRGRHDQAIDHAHLALLCYEKAGHAGGQSGSLNTVGWSLAMLGRYTEALVWCQRALALQEETGEHVEQAHTWDSLGYIHRHLGEFDRAITCYEHALTLFADVSDRYELAFTLNHLGDTHLASGDRPAAEAVWQRALVILTELNHPEAADLRNKLRPRSAG